MHGIHGHHVHRLTWTLDGLQELSGLWMREFYLELCDVAQLP